MEVAIEMAKEAMRAGEVPIGCVIVNSRTGDIVASGRNRTNETKNATRHAELEALDKLKEHNATDLIMYVTVEPCIMCTCALRKVCIKKVFFGCWNDRFGGCGSVLDAHEKYSSNYGTLSVVFLKEYRTECVSLLRHFYLTENSNAPVPKKKDKRVFKDVVDEES